MVAAAIGIGVLLLTACSATSTSSFGASLEPRSCSGKGMSSIDAGSGSLDFVAGSVGLGFDVGHL